jgi:hypothetical protein
MQREWQRRPLLSEAEQSMARENQATEKVYERRATMANAKTVTQGNELDVRLKIRELYT